MHAWIPIRNKQKTYQHYALPINAEEKQLQFFVKPQLSITLPILKGFHTLQQSF